MESNWRELEIIGIKHRYGAEHQIREIKHKAQSIMMMKESHVHVIKRA